MLQRRTRFIAIAAALLALVAPGNREGAAAASAQPANVRPDHYIVVLRDGAGDPRRVADEHARQHGAAVEHVYEHALRGYAAMIPGRRLAAVRNDPRVLYISEDREVHAVAQTTPRASIASTARRAAHCPATAGAASASTSR